MTDKTSIFKVLQAVSHDILEPLRTIKWYGNRILRNTTIRPETKVKVKAFVKQVSSTQAEFRRYYDSFKENREIDFYRDYAKEILGPKIGEIESNFYDLWPSVKKIQFKAKRASTARFQSIVRRLENRYQELLKLLGMEETYASLTNIREEFIRVTHDVSAILDDADVSADSIAVLGNISDRVNRIQIGLVLQNLLINSVKFRRKDVEPDIRIMMWSLKKELLIDRVQHLSAEAQLQSMTCPEVHLLLFSDNGQGIPRKQWDEVFIEFVRGDNSAEIVGSGMGLSIVKELVSQHHGAVWLKSTPGKGTKTYIALPKIESYRSPLPLSRLRDQFSAP